MATSKAICPQCGSEFEAENGHLNRARKVGAPLYCGRTCMGLARRMKNPPTEEEKRVAKAAYDRIYRAQNLEAIKAKKAAHYQATRDPVKEAAKRKERMPLHLEYCRRPEYRAYKSDYDRRKRFEKYGEFAEAAMLMDDIKREINSRSSAYERRVANGYYTRSAQKRRRELWQAIQRKN